MVLFVILFCFDNIVIVKFENILVVVIIVGGL